MTAKAHESDLSPLLQNVQSAVDTEQLTQSAAENIRKWLTEPRYSDYAAEVAEHIRQGRWKELDDAFWTVIPFGTGGRRGRMYAIGSNAINDRTIGESAMGLAAHVRSVNPDGQRLTCAIAYDTRHNSQRFARLCAEIMVANGFHVYLLEPYRSTPELSFLVRHKQCACGIMVTASHNPPTDNAVKCYWSTGGQLLPPHDRQVIDCVMAVDAIERVDFDQAVREGKISDVTQETDEAFVQAALAQSLGGPRDVKILYSPMHGVGATAVVPVLERAGFHQLEVFAPHREPSGDFPNVPGHVSNPENPRVFDAMIQRAQEIGADVVLATDPDCDRLGCAAPETADPAGAWRTFNGNQIGALLTDFILQRRQDQKTLSPQHYVIKTLVTTELIRRITDQYGARTVGDVLVGFKWIGGIIDQENPQRFVFGAEESHGYLAGSHVRDKDAAVAALLLAELAADVKAAGQTLHDKLESLYWQYGYHAEQLLNQTMTGSEGMARMISLMHQLRSDPPRTIGGMAVANVRDYANNTQTVPGNPPQHLHGPQGDMVILDLAEPGNYVAVRPSGTEPKVKFYLFAYVPPELIPDMDEVAKNTGARLQAMQADLVAFADAIA